MKTVAFVPVRGDSKAIPQKNIKPFCGQPLVYWTLSSLQHCDKIDSIFVGTDSAEIKSIVASLKLSKVSFYDRDPSTATDTASTESAMLDCISKTNLEADDTFVLVQATSPFTTEADISAALTTFQDEDIDSLLSVVPFQRFIWDASGKAKNYDVFERPRRQDMPQQYLENGAIYISSVASILQHKNRLSGTIGYHVMPEFTAFEIDETSDWIIAEQLMKRYIL
jgi:N-acylneuraminate cytidylyltransferase